MAAAAPHGRRRRQDRNAVPTCAHDDSDGKDDCNKYGRRWREIVDVRANLCPDVGITTHHISGKASCGNLGQRQVVVAQELCLSVRVNSYEFNMSWARK